MEKIFYVLFNNHENGLKLNSLLKENSLKSTISPTPRSLSKCCGISLIVEEDELEDVKRVVKENDIEIIAIESLERDINPNRDVYC
ncbi:MAG: hypothetical protein PEPC_00052 [Peptostreptococcus russellii]|uniref:Putative Se/S carrier protein-like domain-containing protein n=1 Tax=Peptostreptococcus russellii TaxID=215200 RepID=A0A2P7Q032_9FIRM|nr:DUF3343 domain-containing protein [Peptostreptococcus russellii]PSJ31324.1 hypothetical protein UF10_05185 [Peptostreptococcus russellii]